MKGTTFQSYVDEIVRIKKLYNAEKNAAKKKEYGRQAYYIMYAAYVMDGVDLYELRAAEVEKMWGHRPTTEQQFNISKSVEEVYMVKQMVDLLNREKTAPAIEKDNIRTEMTNLFRTIYAKGNSMDEFLDQSLTMFHGRKITDADRKEYVPVYEQAAASIDKMKASEKKKWIPAQASRSKKRPKIGPFQHQDRWGTTYSGADMNVFMAFPGYRPIEVGVASTVSYTTYREKKQIRTLGRVSAKGITKGPRTISGRLIFTVLSEHIVESLRREIPYLRDMKTILMDELPSFDLLVSFGNEYGSGAGLVIQGITTVDEQKTLTVEDMFTENIFTYLARYLEPMRDLHSKNPSEPYNPLDWFSSDFRPASSEALAKFQAKDLMVYKESLLLADPTPFVGGPGEWDSEMAKTMKATNGTVAGVNTGGGSSGGGGGNTGTGDGGGSGAGGKKAVPGSGKGSGTKKGMCRVVLHVYDEHTHNRPPVSGATAGSLDFSQKATTDKNGYAHIWVDNKQKEYFFKATKSGYDPTPVLDRSNPRLVQVKGKSVVNVQLPLLKKLAGGDCSGTLGKTTATVLGTGYWNQKGAAGDWIPPYKNGTKILDKSFRPSVKVLNKCGEPIEGVYVQWQWENTNISSVKNKARWDHGMIIFKNVDKSGKLGTTKTDKNGIATCPEYSYGKHPEGSRIKIRAKAGKYAMIPDESKVVIKEMTRSFFFYLKPTGFGLGSIKLED